MGVGPKMFCYGISLPLQTVRDFVAGCRCRVGTGLLESDATWMSQLSAAEPTPTDNR